MLKKLLEWDRDTFVYLNNLGIEEYDQFWSIITNFQFWIPLFTLFVLLVFINYPKREAFYIVLTIIAMIICVGFATDLTKNYVARLRPNNTGEINTIIRILKSPTSYSFFSGHSASSFSITTIVVLFLRRHFKWVYIFYAWPVLFALSRIFVGVHYPVDIIVGAGVGILFAVAFYKIYAKIILPYIGSGHP